MPSEERPCHLLHEDVCLPGCAITAALLAMHVECREWSFPPPLRLVQSGIDPVTRSDPNWYKLSFCWTLDPNFP